MLAVLVMCVVLKVCEGVTAGGAQSFGDSLLGVGDVRTDAFSNQRSAQKMEGYSGLSRDTSDVAGSQWVSKALLAENRNK